MSQVVVPDPSQKHGQSTTANVSNGYEQEISSLKQKLAACEEEKAEKLKIFNQETIALESQMARLRSQVERGETTRQTLEYELTLAKKATNQVKRIAVEKEAETNNNVTAMKDKLSEMTLRFSEVEKELETAKNQMTVEKEQFVQDIEEKTIALESQMARLRSQVERGETTRQTLEYELTLAKKATNQVKRIAVEKEAETNNNVTAMKDKMSEMTLRFSEVEKELETAKNQMTVEKEQFVQDIEEKENRIKEVIVQLESAQKETSGLHEIVKEQQNSMLQLEEKCASLEAQRRSQHSTLRHQAKDLEYGIEREERTKKELEQARERVKTLEEHVEAERASHLETKFNSEVIQLRVRDLEGDLDVKKMALNEALESLQEITKQSREFEEGLHSERGKCDQLMTKLKQLQEKFVNEKKRTKHDQEEKQTIIMDLSQQLEAHQGNFNSLKKELHQAKKHQSEFDRSYSCCLKDLEKLVETFSNHKSPKTRNKTVLKNEEPVSASLTPLVDQLRDILLEHQTTRTNAVNENKQLKVKMENLTRENDGYQKLMWARDQAVEEVKDAAQNAKRQLSDVKIQLANKETHCASLEVDVQEMKRQLEEQRRHVENQRQQLAEFTHQQSSNDQTRLSLLHTMYQCLISGELYKTPSNEAYKEFTFEDMMRFLSDQIATHVSETNRAKEKIAHLEEILNNKEQHVKQAQENHESTVQKLSSTLKEREISWKNQTKEMEEHYGKLITDLHLRIQKTQEVSDDSWQKLLKATASVEELEIQNKTLKNSRKKYIREKTVLLSSCVLLAGTLWPACVKIENLKNQKRTLTEINSRLTCLEEHTRFLCDTLRSELSGVASPCKGSDARAKRGFILKFRVAVVAVLALNRMVYFASRRKTSIMVSERITGELDSQLVVHCGPPKVTAFRGISRREVAGSEFVTDIPPSWFCNESLMSIATESMSELYEKLSRNDHEKGQQMTLSPDSRVSLARTAKHCYQKLLSKLRLDFESCSNGSSERRHVAAKNDLVLILGNGLHRCLRRDNHSKSFTSAQVVVKDLQNLVLSLTKRLHKVEVERRDLRLQADVVCKENYDLKRTVEKRQSETELVHKDVENMREKLTTSVPRAQFDKIYSELSSALEREKQAQSILNRQDAQLKDVEKRLNSLNQNSEKSDATLAEAVKSLSEAKLEIKRKEKHIRQMAKDTKLIDNEKLLMQEKLNDAEKAIKNIARERENVLCYLKGIQKGLEKNKALLKQTSISKSLHELSKFLSNDARLSMASYQLGPTILACQNIVNGFLEVHQQTLVVISQLEASKQQAQVKIDALETEINSHRSHINVLKDELVDACQRQLNEHDLRTSERIPTAIPTTLYNPAPIAALYHQRSDSGSYNKEFLPLMRYDSLSPIKSPRKQEPLHPSAAYGEHETKQRSVKYNR